MNGREPRTLNLTMTDVELEIALQAITETLERSNSTARHALDRIIAKLSRQADNQPRPLLMMTCFHQDPARLQAVAAALRRAAAEGQNLLLVLDEPQPWAGGPSAPYRSVRGLIEQMERSRGCSQCGSTLPGAEHPGEGGEA